MPTDPDSRTRILEAARRLFHEQGYAATGVSTILREAEVHPGSLYHHFENKEALLAGVLEHYRTLLDPLVMAPVEVAEADPIERVFALLAFYRAGLVSSACRMGCPIGNLALEVSDNHPEIRPLIAQNFEAWRARVAQWLADAGPRLPAGTTPGQLAAFVLTVMEGAVMQARASGALDAFDASVAELRRSLGASAARRRPRTAKPKRRKR